MMLSTAVSGQPFSGADIPSFFGPQTDHTFICAYQLGIFLPFFRAHSHEEWTQREPYLQTDRV
jgi:mannosyl-oligosaccharide alpha-1,3-glucosidase